MRKIISIIVMNSVFAGAGLAMTNQPEITDAEFTVVIANRNVPASSALARHYMSLRGIPTNHLCELDLPVTESISRRWYEQKLRDPLLAFLREQELIEQVKRDEKETGVHDSGWRTTRSQVRYIVSMHGVPLRIAETRPFLLDRIKRLIEEPFMREGAAVDSELACLLWESYDLKSYVANPFYNYLFIHRNERHARPVVIAARLDGPDESIVRRMIDDAVATEQNGLGGRAYVDTRSTRDADYQLGDFWLNEAGFRLSRYGFDVVQDRQESLFNGNYPLQDAAVYLGWYSTGIAGPFTNQAFTFRSGAVAYHIYSGSAKSLRSRDASWASMLIASGAAVTMGAVDEPYLPYTPDLQIFTDRLLSGQTFGESAYLSLRSLSWQMTIVGDPLYRPFAFQPEANLRRREEASDPGVVWTYIRRMNLLADQHQLNVALNYGREMLKKTGSPIIREKLADMYAKNELWTDAVQAYRAVVDEATDEMTAIRVGRRLLMIMRMIKQEKEAAALEASIRLRWPDSVYLRHLDGATW